MEENKSKDKATVRKANISHRNQKIASDFKDLYQVQRLRIDDCITALAAQYFLSAKTIERIVANQK